MLDEHESGHNNSFADLVGTQLFREAVLTLLIPAALGRLACASQGSKHAVASLDREVWVRALLEQGQPANHPVFRANNILAYLAAQCAVQRNFRRDATHPVHQPERLQLTLGAVLSNCAPFQVASVLLLGEEHVLALHAARASAAHLCVQLPQLPQGLAFNRLYFSPSDRYLLLLPSPTTERARLLEDAEAVTLCVADLHQETVTTWQVPQPGGVLRLPFLGWSPSGCCFICSRLLPPEESGMRPDSELCAYTVGGRVVGSRRVARIRTPVWSPCGQQLAATEHAEGVSLWAWQPATGTFSSRPIRGGSSEDVLCWSPCSRWLLLSHPGAKTAQIYSSDPVAAVSSHTLSADLTRVSWSLQGIAVLHQDWQAGLEWDLCQRLYALTNVETDDHHMRPILAVPIASRSLSYLVGPASNPEGNLVAFTMRKTNPDGSLQSCTLIVSQVDKYQLSGRQRAYDVGFEADVVRWTTDGLQLVVSGTHKHLILHYHSFPRRQQ